MLQVLGLASWLPIAHSWDLSGLAAPSPESLSSRLCLNLAPLPGENVELPVPGQPRTRIGFPSWKMLRPRWMISHFESNVLQREVRTHRGQPSLTQHKAPTFPKCLGDAFTPELSPAPLTRESSQAKKIRGSDLEGFLSTKLELEDLSLTL